IWVPNYAPLRQILLEEFHDVPYAGHFGSNKTLAGIAKYYYWPGMAADVQQFVTSCDTCQRMKSSKKKKTGLLQPLPILEQPWQVISLDFITGLPHWIWVPNYAPLRQILLEEFHDVPYAGHFGSNKTLAGIAKYYYWPGMAADVQQFVTSCDTCQRMKSSKKKKTGLLQPLPILEQPWQVISLDFITGLPSTPRGHDSILVVIDKFSKMGHFIPTNATATAEAIARLFFDRIITIHGIPATLISDRDPKFTSKFWKELMGLLGTKLAISTLPSVYPRVMPVTKPFTSSLPTVISSLLPVAETPSRPTTDTPSKPANDDEGRHDALPSAPRISIVDGRPAPSSENGAPGMQKQAGEQVTGEHVTGEQTSTSSDVVEVIGEAAEKSSGDSSMSDVVEFKLPTRHSTRSNFGPGLGRGRDRAGTGSGLSRVRDGAKTGPGQGQGRGRSGTGSGLSRVRDRAATGPGQGRGRGRSGTGSGPGQVRDGAEVGLGQGRGQGQGRSGMEARPGQVRDGAL
ncbi:unnamed protein product, partial [Closterium sp. NIES-54]